MTAQVTFTIQVQGVTHIKKNLVFQTCRGTNYTSAVHHIVEFSIWPTLLLSSLLAFLPERQPMVSYTVVLLSFYCQAEISSFPGSPH